MGAESGGREMLLPDWTSEFKDPRVSGTKAKLNVLC